jgi:holliday junction DNA helicase RuvA
MIEQLIGNCVHKDDRSIVINVNGVGYGIQATAALQNSLQVNEDDSAKKLTWIHTHVREDQITLFGFADILERQLFRLLITVNRVGPKVAMGVLSALSVEEIINATLNDDPKTLAKAPKIGAAQAKKLILELRPKLEKLDALAAMGSSPKSGAESSDKGAGSRLSSQICADLKSALENLGYKEKEVLPVVRHLSKNSVDSDLPELIREALTLMGSTLFTDKQADLNQIF